MPFVLSALALLPVGASAQDLFELEVFSAETTPAGGYEVEFHTNGMSRGAMVTDVVAANHRPVHLSVEVPRRSVILEWWRFSGGASSRPTTSLR